LIFDFLHLNFTVIIFFASFRALQGSLGKDNQDGGGFFVAYGSVVFQNKVITGNR
jgi:hypothetical protein